ncbi:MAG: phosphonate ABC transporter, permease protein PhnE [Ewingella americana]|jgi:phosphonate transport system permease protein|uniref:phosphonate ABC transporter, permease protein PhnE n=1 Tax=Ewingella americana TaxID=41202 RepID=UPI000C2FA3D3|nr:phosphonate ABC transporter, permease protein PhnE [Ewingella americana]MCI1676957.1 phosphonate ABC transporter, permease protein PhnE [Ewingella americana]MCI1853453.1 phosphonate ABC transporter, permease protein PhnE [Ewingella americana]MCI1860306.1 phosphonate ABC transporter, permease protein PhnE [Ewingella americana]MCI2143098.1 phosphonate ABC transporter, permease protein PhnE [Ewingella americana]MCI2162840.1 phosphonate ABC transporter, permease protein PhnE [Ewingella american
MLTEALAPSAIATIKRDNPKLFSAQRRYLRYLGAFAVLITLYYIYFFTFYGIPWSAVVHGSSEIGRYFLRMFVWHNFSEWPLMYYFEQIVMTLAIVFAGTITASFLALPLSFLAARNVMSTPVLRPISLVVRRILDVLRGLDMAIWGLIFVRAVGMGPLAGVLAIILQDLGLLGKLYAEGHEAVERSPSRGLRALGANPLQTHRFGIFTQSFPTFLALSLYQIESNTRSAAVLGFVGAGGIGLVYAENMRLWNWDVVMFITLILVVIVMAMDKISSILRAKYIHGEDIDLFEAPPKPKPPIELYKP